MPTTLIPTASWPRTLTLRLPRGGSLEIPPLRDPRYLVWGCQVLFFLVGVLYLNFLKGLSILSLALVTGAFADALLCYLFRRRWVFPQSGLVCAAGVALLLEASTPLLYVLTVLLALGSKYVFSVDKRHFFNPTAFGLVCVLSFFPNQAVTNPVQWTGTVQVWWLIVALGLFTAWRAGVMDMVIAWVFAYYVGAVVRGALGLAPMNLSLVIPSGAGFALYVFFMITDPKTIPLGTWRRLAFAFLVALGDGVVRTLGKPNSLYIGLVAAQYLVGLAAITESWWRSSPGAGRSGPAEANPARDP